jgi:hypothetical protein
MLARVPDVEASSDLEAAVRSFPGALDQGKLAQADAREEWGGGGGGGQPTPAAGGRAAGAGAPDLRTGISAG